MNEKLTGYIRKNAERGFSTDMTRQTLLRAGYDANVVEEHMRHAFGPGIKNYLIGYIRKNLEAGYHKDVIKNALLKAGYGINEVEDHIKHILGSHPKTHFIDKIKLDFGTNAEKKLIVALIAIGVIVVSVLSFNYFFGSDKEIEAPNAGLGTVSTPEEALNLMNKALIKNDETICDQIGDADLMEQCKNTFAINEPCDEECENKKMFNLAIIKNNESLCIGIIDEKIKEDGNNIFNKPLVNETEKICDEACK